MAVYSALLGPFLDGYHGAFGVLEYVKPIFLYIGDVRIVRTASWVPPLFGFAGVIMGLLYTVLDQLWETPPEKSNPSWPKVFAGISFFSMQYYLSGLLTQEGMEVPQLTALLISTAFLGFYLFDGSKVRRGLDSIMFIAIR